MSVYPALWMIGFLAIGGATTSRAPVAEDAATTAERAVEAFLGGDFETLGATVVPGPAKDPTLASLRSALDKLTPLVGPARLALLDGVESGDADCQRRRYGVLFSQQAQGSLQIDLCRAVGRWWVHKVKLVVDPIDLGDAVLRRLLPERGFQLIDERCALDGRVPEIGETMACEAIAATGVTLKLEIRRAEESSVTIVSAEVAAPPPPPASQGTLEPPARELIERIFRGADAAILEAGSPALRTAAAQVRVRVAELSEVFGPLGHVAWRGLDPGGRRGLPVVRLDVTSARGDRATADVELVPYAGRWAVWSFDVRPTVGSKAERQLIGRRTVRCIREAVVAPSAEVRCPDGGMLESGQSAQCQVVADQRAFPITITRAQADAAAGDELTTHFEDFTASVASELRRVERAMDRKLRRVTCRDAAPAPGAETYCRADYDEGTWTLRVFTDGEGFWVRDSRPAKVRSIRVGSGS